MPTIELVRHEQTNEIMLRLAGTERAYMYGADGLTFYTYDPQEAIETARHYAALKGWDVDETIPPRNIVRCGQAN